MCTSDPQEALCEARHDPAKLKGCISGGEADAIGPDIGDRHVIDLFIRDLDIARRKTVGFIRKGPLQHQRKLGPAMAMTRHRCARPGQNISQNCP